MSWNKYIRRDKESTNRILNSVEKKLKLPFVAQQCYLQKMHLFSVRLPTKDGHHIYMVKLPCDEEDIISRIVFAYRKDYLGEEMAETLKALESI